MHKTGSLHIRALLSYLFDGEIIGQHLPATEDQINSGRYLVSSIRNPWDWYLSLWTYGVEGKGAVRKRLTNKELHQTLQSTTEDATSDIPESLWLDVYDRNDNVESFRKWLELIHNPVHSRLVSGRYGKTALPDLCGLMTFRYLYLCCQNFKELNKLILKGIKKSRFAFKYDDLVQFENKNCYIGFFIRQESLEDDLCEIASKVRSLTQAEKDHIYSAPRRNKSERSLSIADYYDEKSIELIFRRERLLVEKFGYSPP
ncbi:MAG: hypothetical protein AAGE59_14065 [Cyanobacteria bacterium P01_F01_bin.86]